jgi:predicted nucleotidyltransferase
VFAPSQRVNFSKVLKEVVGELEMAGVRYALIGGFAMALRGVQRATMDLDFILLLGDLDRADSILRRFGYRREFHNENVSHYAAPDSEWGRIDILHAFRAPSLGMLQRADHFEVETGVHVRVAQAEDIIGLKIQAAANDPARAIGDWEDIRLLLLAARSQGDAVDWELLRDYLRLFGLEAKLAQLKEIYGAIE